MSGCEPALGAYRFARDFLCNAAELTGGQAVALSSAAMLADVAGRKLHGLSTEFFGPVQASFLVSRCKQCNLLELWNQFSFWKKFKGPNTCVRPMDGKPFSEIPTWSVSMVTHIAAAIAIGKSIFTYLSSYSNHPSC